MSQRKRNLPSEAERAVPPPSTKKTKLPMAAEMPPPTTLEEAIKIIDMFKAEQASLAEHISKTDRNILNAPPNIKALIQQGQEGFSILATAIGKNMATATRDLEDDFQCGVATSDDLSKVVFPFIAMIRELVDGENGDELTKVRAGYSLLTDLKCFSAGELDEDGGGQGDRPPDKPADDLFSEVIRRRKEAGDTWDWWNDLEDLKWEAKQHASYGIEPWFPKSTEALSAICAVDGDPPWMVGGSPE